jgi:hypothetical protein
MKDLQIEFDEKLEVRKQSLITELSMKWQRELSREEIDCITLGLLLGTTLI